MAGHGFDVQYRGRYCDQCSGNAACVAFTLHPSHERIWICSSSLQEAKEDLVEEMRKHWAEE